MVPFRSVEENKDANFEMYRYGHSYSQYCITRRRPPFSTAVQSIRINGKLIRRRQADSPGAVGDARPELLPLPLAPPLTHAIAQLSPSAAAEQPVRHETHAGLDCDNADSAAVLSPCALESAVTSAAEHCPAPARGAPAQAQAERHPCAAGIEEAAVSNYI